MGGTLKPFHETGFDLEGSSNERMQHLQAYTESGVILIRVLVDMGFTSSPTTLNEVVQFVSPRQARAMGRLLIALAAETDLLVDGTGPLMKDIPYNIWYNSPLA